MADGDWLAQVAEDPSAPQRAPQSAPPAADEAALLRQFLAHRDVARPQCDYNLPDLVGDRCPECGENLAVGCWIVALAGIVVFSLSVR